VPARGSGVASSRLRIEGGGAPRAVTGEFNGERVTGLTWPAANEHTTVLELTY
jgi:hypothetical protein